MKAEASCDCFDRILEDGFKATSHRITCVERNESTRTEPFNHHKESRQMTTTTEPPKRYITCIHCGRKFEYEPPIAQEKYGDLISKAAKHGRHCPKDPMLKMLRALGDT